MVRLYKAIMNTGATVEIKPVKDIMAVMFIFRYRGEERKTLYSLEAIGNTPMTIDEMLSDDLARFVSYVNTHGA